MELKFDNLQNEFRNAEENRIELDHENMALKDTVNVVQKAKDDADQRVKETDGKYRYCIIFIIIFFSPTT